MQLQRSRNGADLAWLCDQEVEWAYKHPHLDGYRETYEGAVRVLVDLARLNWCVQEDRFGIELQAPAFLPKPGLRPEQIAESKQSVRAELEPLRNAQFAQEATIEFIQRMEKPSPKTHRQSILLLVADGRELRARLEPALSVHGDERAARLSDAVRPYLQLVGPNEVDEQTGIRLGDIWRYFRYTWSLPAINIPGRQLFYLVRDAAHPHHAIMGIAALSNCAMQMRDRDNFIGWTTEAFIARVDEALRAPEPRAELQRLFAILEQHITNALAEVSSEGLVTKAEIRNPSCATVARLRRLSHEFADDRKAALGELIGDSEQPSVVQELEAGPYGLPPIADDVLALEKKVHDQEKYRKARSLMVAKKRAFELSRLLAARLRFRKIKEAFLDPARTRSVLHLEESRTAITTAWIAAKTRRVGANLLELTTCGGIPPYTHLLTGKLTALLMLSPQIAADYRGRYGEEPSIIGSLLKNKPLVRDSTLVYVGTTSLYAVGSSQYERLRLPAGVIAPGQPELRFRKLGHTSGYGTVQFAAETVRAVDKVLQNEFGFRNVNSIFGEGPSPRLRKLRAGLQLLGFDSENLMRHNQHRLIYGVPLYGDATAFLRGETDETPQYLAEPEKYSDATERIADFWRARWLASRLNYASALESLKNSPSWRLSGQIPVGPVEVKPDATPPARSPEVATPDPEVQFWRTLAHAGPKVCSDELTPHEIERMHVQRPIEDFLLARVREGFSIVLTGNAGDGKTHLLRRLVEKLNAERRKVEWEPDATAAMRGGDVAPVLDRWRKSVAAKRPFLLAANEYPLYQLRHEGPARAPKLTAVLQEVDRQCRTRLAYGRIESGEAADQRVLVIDLSLRNPLHGDFAGALLDKMLESRALQMHAASAADPNFGANFERLRQSRIRERLLGLLHRVMIRGERAPVREVWIWFARLLFGARVDNKEIPGAKSASYSERFFETDDRFHLTQLIRDHADPAWCSHPQWDARLESRGGTQPKDWLDGAEPTFPLGELDASRFSFLKRLFYFEHARGHEAFALEPPHAKLFQEVLDDASSADPHLVVREIVGAINLCYCPRRFRGIEERLYLWVGHRFHELPTRSYVANQSIPVSDFEVLLPRLPSRVQDALDYECDHFLLHYRSRTGRAVGLRVDFSLFATLKDLGAGLPRHLLPERDLNRLDAFLEQLQAAGIEGTQEFVTFNTEHRMAARIRLSRDGKRYLKVKRNE